MNLGVTINLPARDKDLKVNGTLIANGTAQNPITFYSSDLNYGGGSIEFLTGSSGSSMRYVILDRLHDLYNGYSNGRDCAVWIEDAEVSIDFCTFTDNRIDVRANADDVYGFGPSNQLYQIYWSQKMVKTSHFSGINLFW